MSPSPQHEPLIGVNHYSGQSGRRYFEYQSRYGEIAGPLNARKFAKHVACSDAVLDFGCGGGSLMSSLHCGRRFGVDINPIARAAATSRGITCYETLAELDNESIDVAIAHHSLEHVPAPLYVLRDIRAKLKPGGLLLIAVPVDDWRRQQKYDPTEINHHLYTWTPLLLGHLLYEAEFDMNTFSTAFGINGWFGAFPRLYGKAPQPLLDVLLKLWCVLRKTREIVGVVRKPDFRLKQ